MLDLFSLVISLYTPLSKDPLGSPWVQHAAVSDSIMNRLPSILRPARSDPRYSVRPFYASVLVITVLAVVSWTVVGFGNGQAHERTAAGVSLRRADEPEVFPLVSRGMINEANRALV